MVLGRFPGGHIKIKNPDYDVLNNNMPKFTKAEIEKGKRGSFEEYSPLDSLGRCGVAYARIGRENEVAEYVRQTDNHILYRVTPVFKGNDLVSRGVQMEAWSLEDSGRIHFNVFVHNVQPDISIDYSDGSNRYIGKGQTS